MEGEEPVRRIAAFEVTRLCGHKEDFTRITYREAVQLAKAECGQCQDSALL